MVSASYGAALASLVQRSRPHTLALFHDESFGAEEVLGQLTARLFRETQVALRVGTMQGEEQAGFEGHGGGQASQASELDLTLLLFANASVCESFLGVSPWRWLSGSLLLVSLEDAVGARYVAGREGRATSLLFNEWIQHERTWLCPAHALMHA